MTRTQTKPMMGATRSSAGELSGSACPREDAAAAPNKNCNLEPDAIEVAGFYGATSVHIRLDERTHQLIGHCIRTDSARPTDIGVPLQCEIWHLMPGVEVLSWCENKGEWTYRRISKVTVHESCRAFTMSYYFERLASYWDLLLTTRQVFRVPGKGWVNAGDLQAGDTFLTPDGSLAAFVGLDAYRYPLTVYNIEVEGFSTYCVGDGLLVRSKIEST